MSISISSLVVPTKTVELEFPGKEGFSVTLCTHSKNELVKLRKKCTTSKWSREAGGPVEILDEEKFVKLYSTSVVKTWSGLKVKYLEEFLVADCGDLDPESEIDFTEDNLITLMKESAEFESWVTNEVHNLANFTQKN